MEGRERALLAREPGALPTSDQIGVAVSSALRDRGAAARSTEPDALVAATRRDAPAPPAELSGHDFAVFLLRVAAEIEHALMVQYLFAAYSLGGPDVPAELRDDVRAWQETILGIAKEEMGHLVTVQNLLTLVRGPLDFDREEFPFDNGLYPFPFRLEPASPDSIAAYVCAESPEQWDDDEAKAVKERAGANVGGMINRVGQLYATLIELIGDRSRVPDGAFDAASVTFQAAFDEWGRGYRAGQRGTEPMAALPDLPAPELLILTAGSRAEAISALEAVGEQGEGFDTPADENESHFRRFLAIYRAMDGLTPEELRAVVRPLATNPRADPLPDGVDTPDPDDPTTRTPVANPEARLWANLFNVRYRALLTNLAHAFELSDDPSDRETLGPRGTLIHRTFSEMYNLRSIAGILVGLPLDAGAPDGARAGPPFQMPHTLMLPRGERSRWMLHRDLIDASGALIAQLQDPARPGQDYLIALAAWDADQRRQLDQLIAATAGAPPAPLVPT